MTTSPEETGDSKPAAEPAPAPRRLRLKAAIVILVLWAAAVLFLWFGPLGFGRGPAVFGTYVSTGLAVLLLAVWAVFFSGLSPRGKLLVLGLPAAAVGLLVATCRVELDGDTWPIRFVFRWIPKQHFTLAAETKPPEAALQMATSREDFPQFLGPDRDGRLTGVRLQRDWQAHPPRELWRRKIGAGWSGFAVVGRYAFTQEQRGTREVVTCYDVASGELQWLHGDDAYFEETMGMGGDGPRATPTVAGEHVYTMGATGLVNCLQAATGSRRWSKNVFQEYGAAVPNWGAACSPLVLDDLVVVTGGGAEGPSLMALDRDTGETRWTAQWSDELPGTISDCYASPSLVRLAGVQQILNLEDAGVAGYDPATGRQIWRREWPWSPAQHPKVAQPRVMQLDHLFLSSAYLSGSALLRLESKRGGYHARLLWSNRNMKTKFCNVVERGGFVFGIDGNILACVALETGKRVWKGGRYGHGQILLVGDLILVMAETGEVALVDASPDGYHEHGRFRAFDDRTWNTLALSGKHLLIRNDREAACYELPLVE